MGCSLKKTIKDYDIAGKRVLLRADYNVPLDSNGNITSDFRITQSLNTIAYLREKGCKIVICSHLGRPDGKPNAKYSLKPVVKRLSELLGTPVYYVGDSVGEVVREASNQLNAGDILVLENVRFYPGEEENDAEYASSLVRDTGAEVLVQDGFGVVHRAHSTTDAVARQIPAVAGLLLEKEVDTITSVMQNPKRPLMAVIGGSKIADKIAIINAFIESADIVAIGGAMANTFLLAQGVYVGDSLVDSTEIDTAQDILERAKAESKKRDFVFYLPQDGVVSTVIDSKTTTRIVDWDAHVIADIEAYPKKARVAASMVQTHEKILDIGPFSGAFIAGAMQLVDTVVWNGTLGVTEVPALHSPVGPFSHGTELLMDGLVGRFGHRPFSVLGGGDTTAYVEQQGMTDMFDHVSTGGGASLELMSGKELPGVAVLWDK